MTTRRLTRWARVASVLCVLAQGWPGEARGQRPPRNGFWIENGVGTGTARSACSDCESATVSYGRASHLRLGARLSRDVLFGVEVFALDSRGPTIPASSESVEAETASIAPVVLWYVGDSGFFVKGGVGLARGTYTMRSPGGEILIARGTGSGLTFGLGFDVPLIRWLALTANLGTYVAAIGDVHLEDEVVDDVIATVYHAAIGVTVR